MELRFGTELSTFRIDVDLNRPLNKADSELRPWNTMTSGRLLWKTPWF